MHLVPRLPHGASAWIAVAALLLALAVALLAAPGALSVLDDGMPASSDAAAAPQPDFLAAGPSEWERWNGSARGR